MTLLGDSSGLGDGPVEWFTRIAMFLVQIVVAVSQVLGKH